jgi:hypothetical protein
MSGRSLEKSLEPKATLRVRQYRTKPRKHDLLSTVSVLDLAEARSSKKSALCKSSDLLNLDSTKSAFLLARSRTPSPVLWLPSLTNSYQCNERQSYAPVMAITVPTASCSRWTSQLLADCPRLQQLPKVHSAFLGASSSSRRDAVNCFFEALAVLKRYLLIFKEPIFDSKVDR